MKNVVLSAIHIYPLKSAAGILQQRSPVLERGLQFDRRWMLIDEDQKFLSQRKLSRMALIKTHVRTGKLHFTAPGMPELEISLNHVSQTSSIVHIWEDSCQAYTYDSTTDAWFSRFLGQSVCLVYMPDESQRWVKQPGDSKRYKVRFADGFPYLLISEASLADLNRRLPEAIEMVRFRPNLVVRGCAPYAEDQWKKIRMGNVNFQLVKPCSRCVITTVDPQTGIAGKEPLKTLATYRLSDGKVLFGQNMIHENEGEIAVGMPLDIVDVG